MIRVYFCVWVVELRCKKEQDEDEASPPSNVKKKVRRKDKGAT